MVTYNYYTNEFKGAEMSETEFDVICPRAEVIIDNLLLKMPVTENELEARDKAVCAETEFIFLRGREEFFAARGEETAEKIGNTEVRREPGGAGKAAPMAGEYLKQASLV